MNFDPFDSAAWRTFNMLDEDESAIFDEAMLHDPVLRSAYLEMDRLSAAIAASTALPIEPKAGQLDRLQARLGLGPSKSAQFWLTISGWAAAAVLAILLTLHLTGIIDQWASPPTTADNPSPPPGDLATAPASADLPNTNIPTPNPANPNGGPAPAGRAVAGKDPDAKITAKVETKRLNQEIEVLRDSLEKFQSRDRVLFEVVPGMALPIVMTMNPPGVAADDPAYFAKNDEHSPLTTLLGDALTALTGTSSATDANPTATAAANALTLAEHPTAIPIYDAARDSGTLVVSNLPPAAADEVYNLWVTTHTGGRPIYVGTLPESSAIGADSFDFSLGSTMVLPSGFVLTRDPQGAPATPSATNTILQGPPTPSR